MRPARSLILAAIVMAASACQKQPPPTPDPSPDGVETIRGTERLGWDQQAFDTAELAAFRYAIYVDGSRSELSEIACASSAGANGFACSGRLPALTPGQHTLELAAFTVEGGSTLESPRSAPLRVNVTALVAGGQSGSIRNGAAGTTSDGVPLRLDVVLEGLDEPADIAFASDGRLFVAERDGMMRVVDGSRQGTTRLDGEILAFALDSEFDRTAHVFVVLASDTAAVARYREVNGTLGERMMLLTGVPTRQDRAAAAIGVGPDNKLYVALDDGGDAGGAQASGSLNGALLRLNRDGTTPDDARPAGMPATSRGYRSPRALAWGTGGVLWLADGAPREPERLSALVDPAGRRARTAAISYALARDTDPADAVVYRGEMFPSFRGNLFVAADGGGHLLRVRFDPRAPARVIATERLLEGFGAIRAVAVAPDGAIYVASPRSLARVSPNP
jgi:glucose/arabinose dehydrogenase